MKKLIQLNNNSLFFLALTSEKKNKQSNSYQKETVGYMKIIHNMLNRQNTLADEP
jgi:hypothetical protein